MSVGLRLAIALLVGAYILMGALMLSGCASGTVGHFGAVDWKAPTERYFSAEEDAKAREVCGETGCAIVPIPLWNQIEQMLRALSGAAI